MSGLTRRLITWLARNEILLADDEAYWRGLQDGRAESPMTCGWTPREHCSHFQIYDPGC